jgi:ParB-like nuclease domain
MKKGNGALILSGCGIDDQTFDSDRGSWNVTRALRDCMAGIHGAPHAFVVPLLMEATANVDIDEAKVVAMVADKARLVSSPPLIFVEDEGRIWLIDGHHRLHAMARLGFPEMAGFVIEADSAEAYRVLFNGQRIAPWYSKKARMK